MPSTHHVVATIDHRRVPLRIANGIAVACDDGTTPPPMTFKEALNLGRIAMQQHLRGVQITDVA
ncbi:MAG: hypothetical protein ACM3UO_00510 [Bacillota bacterium]